MAAVLALAAPAPSTPPSGLDVGYEPGTCNIGPAEIARRRRTGHTGVIASLVVLAILLVVHAPPVARLVVFLPAAIAASGYLQSRLRFCAGFGWLGVFNVEDVGTAQQVADAAARARDRAMAVRVGLASAALGAIAAVIALALPA
jgi:hypothetical protein